MFPKNSINTSVSINVSLGSVAIATRCSQIIFVFSLLPWCELGVEKAVQCVLELFKKTTISLSFSRDLKVDGWLCYTLVFEGHWPVVTIPPVLWYHYLFRLFTHLLLRYCYGELQRVSTRYWARPPEMHRFWSNAIRSANAPVLPRFFDAIWISYDAARCDIKVWK